MNEKTHDSDQTKSEVETQAASLSDVRKNEKALTALNIALATGLRAGATTWVWQRNRPPS